MVHTSAWVLWGSIVHALQRDLLRDTSCKKMYAVPVYRDKERSVGVLEQHGCSSDPCIACPLAFRYRVFLPVELLVLSY